MLILKIEKLQKIKSLLLENYEYVKAIREQEKVQEELDVLNDLEGDLKHYINELEALEQDKIKGNWGLSP